MFKLSEHLQGAEGLNRRTSHLHHIEDIAGCLTTGLTFETALELIDFVLSSPKDSPDSHGVYLYRDTSRAPGRGYFIVESTLEKSRIANDVVFVSYFKYGCERNIWLMPGSSCDGVAVRIGNRVAKMRTDYHPRQ